MFDAVLPDIVLPSKSVDSIVAEYATEPKLKKPAVATKLAPNLKVLVL